MWRRDQTMHSIVGKANPLVSLADDRGLFGTPMESLFPRSPHPYPPSHRYNGTPKPPGITVAE